MSSQASSVAYPGTGSQQKARTLAGRRRGKADSWILYSVMLLVAIGFLMVWSTTAVLSSQQYTSQSYMIVKHLFTIFLGAIAMGICMQIPSQLLYRFSAPLFVGSIFLLALVLLPGIGVSAGGAQRWLALGPLRLQPGELAKLSSVLFIAAYMKRQERKFGQFKTAIVVPFGLLSVVAMLLLLQPDFGSTVVVASVVVLQLALAARFSHILSLFCSGCMMVVLLIWTSPYRMRRLITFLDPFEDPSSAGYQLIQSLIAVGSQGIYGAGIGAGKQKLFYLPAAHTDFIFAVVAEELGLIGCTLVLGLFFVILWRGVDLANALRDEIFYSALSLGLTLLIVLPAMLNMGVVLGLLPTKGLVLPLIAYGGTSMLVQMSLVGLLLNLSRLRES